MNNRLWIPALLAVLSAGILVGAQQTQQAKPAAPAGKQRTVKSQGEHAGLMAVIQAPDADTRIKAAEEFVTKYADSDFRGLALLAEAQSYQQKNDYDKMVIYGERALEANPDDSTRTQTMLMLANAIALRTREFDLDREEKLARVEKYANGAMELLKTEAKPNPNLPDEQWAGIKSDLEAEGHEALAMAAMARKNYDAAIAEFKTANETAKDKEPATELRLGNAYNLAKKYDDAIATLDKLLAEPNLPPQIRQLAQAERVKAIQAKGGPAKPATPPPAAGASGSPPPTPAPAKPAEPVKP